MTRTVRSFLGTPCYGLCGEFASRVATEVLGFAVPDPTVVATARTAAQAGGDAPGLRRVTLDEAQPGDLVLLQGLATTQHLAVVAEDGYLLDGSAGRTARLVPLRRLRGVLGVWRPLPPRTVRVVSYESIVGGAGRQELELVGHPTVGGAIAAVRDRWPAGTRLRVVADGKEISEDDYGTVCPGIVSVWPAVQGVEVLVLLAISLISAGLSYAMSRKAIAAAKRLPQDPNDNAPHTGFRGVASTTYGPGWMVPLVLGAGRVGGQLVGLRVDPASWSYRAEVGSFLLAIAEGPIYSVGGIKAEPYGERDDMGRLDYRRQPFVDEDPLPIPSGLRVDGVLLDRRGAVVSLRMGRNDQSRISGWATSSSVEQVNKELVDRDDYVISSIPESKSTYILWTVDLPLGLYQQVGSGRNPATIELVPSWRIAGTEPWIDGPTYRLTALEPRGLAVSVPMAVVPPGPFDVRLRRVSPRGDDSMVNQTSVRLVRWNVPYGFTHPGTALVSVSLTTDRDFSSTPAFSVLIDGGLLVRGWDTATGFTPYGWAATAPWSHPIGLNPAWVMLELLLNEEIGVGRYIKQRLGGTGDEEPDLDAFRDWADFCDQDDPLDVTRAKFQCTLVVDTEQDAWQVFLDIAKCGRAMPYMAGSRVTITYDYRDAHGRGTNAVPAKVPTFSISTSNCSDVQIGWRDVTQRPNEIICQMNMNRAKDWARDTFTVPDPDLEVTGEDGYPARIIQTALDLRGISIAEHARREAIWLIRGNRLVTVEATVQTGLQNVGVQVGDVGVLQHVSWYPDALNPTGSMRCQTDAPLTPTSQIMLDRALAVVGPRPTGTGLFIVTSETDPAQRVRLVTVDEDPGVIPAGTLIDLWDPIQSQPALVRVRAGSIVTTGVYGAFERKVKCIGVDVGPDWTMRLDLEEWVDAVHDDPPEEVLTDSGTVADADPLPTLPDPLAAPDAPVAVGSDGSSVAWVSSGGVVERESRVWVRRVGETSWDDRGASETGRLNAELEPGAVYEVVVAPRGPGGALQAPDDSAVSAALVASPEYGATVLQAPGVVVAAPVDAGLLVSWAPIDGAARYEVRMGGWCGAGQVGLTDASALLIDRPPSGAAVAYWVGAYSAQGRLGHVVGSAPFEWLGWEPAAKVGSRDELATAGGTHSGTTIVAQRLGLVAGVARGTYTTASLDLGKPLLVYWSALVVSEAVHHGPILEDEGPIALDSQCLVACAEPTSLRPGVDWAAEIAGDAGLVGEWGASTVGGTGRALGQPQDVRIEARTSQDGVAWSAWETWRAGYRLARALQWRLTIYRSSLAHDVGVTKLILEAIP